MPLTLDDIAEMMNSNKKEIISKVDGIVEEVKEVKTQVNILAQRADSQDKTNCIVNDKIELLQRQISELKDCPGASYAQVTRIEGQTAQLDIVQTEADTSIHTV